MQVVIVQKMASNGVLVENHERETTVCSYLERLDTLPGAFSYAL